MTIEEQLLEASANLSGLTAERDDLRATVEKLTVGAAAELEQLKVEASVKDASIATLTEALKAVEAEAAALKASAQSASAEAANILAASGVEPVAAPVASAAEGSIVEQYAAMPAGAERRAFFKKHKALLFSAK